MRSCQNKVKPNYQKFDSTATTRQLLTQWWSLRHYERSFSRTPPAAIATTTFSVTKVAVLWCSCAYTTPSVHFPASCSNNLQKTKPPLHMASFTWVQRVVVIVRTGLRGYGTWYGKAPVVMAFATCFTKGLLSDTIAQTMLIEDYNKQAEAEEEGGDGNAVGAPPSSSQPQRTWDWMRYAAMSLYSGL